MREGCVDERGLCCVDERVRGGCVDERGLCG